ncbi:MAG: hypothetical protein U0M15_09385 [Bacillota bacterium]|nr:hypothetical protein [Bacillota bacterium]
MAWLKTLAFVAASFFTITLIFVTINGLELFPWEVMEILWVFYLPSLAMAAAMLFSKKITRPGGGIFAAFCCVAPPVIISYYLGLPFADNLFRPLPIILSAVSSILGESFVTFRRKSIEKSEDL